MKIDVLTIFPKMFVGPISESLIGKAQEKGLLEINIHDLRDWANDKHKSVDDRPFGGGPGMVMRVDVVDRALDKLSTPEDKHLGGQATKPKVILLTPQGEKFEQKLAQDLSKEEHLILICGHYEGVDERVRKHLVDMEISIGDYVLTGGEIPAMVLIDTVGRLIPKVVGKPKSLENESFFKNRLDFPQYTRPVEYQGWKVPEVLRSGNHAKIKKWREEKSFEKTKKRRPDLIKE